MRKLKLGAKLLGGFGLVAVVGGVGFWGANRMSGDIDDRRGQLANFERAREELYEHWEYFLTLPATGEEVRLRENLQRELEEWAALNDQWLEMNNEFEAIGILDPNDLVANLQLFRGDHYALELDVSMLLLAGREFEGGEDPTACNFGRWWPEFETENRGLEQMIRDIQVPHNVFHEAVAEVRDELAAGN